MGRHRNDQKHLRFRADPVVLRPGQGRREREGVVLAEHEVDSPADELSRWIGAALVLLRRRLSRLELPYPLDGTTPV